MGVHMTTKEDVIHKLTGVLRDGVDIHRCAAATALGQMEEHEAVDALIDALHDEDEDVRTDVAAALLRLGDPRAAMQLMENLIGDPCGEVKIAALQTLTRMRHHEVVPWLRRITLSRDEEIAWDDDSFYSGGWDDWVDLQIKAIEALADFGCEDAVPDIVTAMQDEMEQDLTEVGFKALVQLGETGVAACVGALNAPNERLRRRVARYLGESDNPAARKALVGALQDTALDVRKIAAQSLAKREPLAPELEVLFDDKSEHMRELAVGLCGAAMPARLQAALADKTHRVRRAVLQLLVEQPDVLASENVTPIATKLLAGEAPKTAAMAARALAAIGAEGAVEALAAQVFDTERFQEVRIAAVRGLVQLAGPDAVGALSTCVLDADRQVRLEAMAGLAGIASDDIAWPNPAGDILLSTLTAEIALEENETEESNDDPDPAVEILADHAEKKAGMNEDPAPGLERDLQSEPAAEQLPEQPKPDGANSTLEAILGADSPELQVVKSGGNVELSPKDLEFLGLAERKLKKRKFDPLPKIAAPLDAQRFAARVLGDIAQPEIAVVLIEQTKGADIELAISALSSLVRIGDKLEGFPEEVEQGLVDILNGNDENRRLLALRALAAAGGDKAAHALKVAMRDNHSFLRLEAIRALSKSGNAEHEQMGEMLSDPDASVRLAAAEAMAAMADNSAMERLVDFTFAFEGFHHREVARLLRGIDCSGASERYLEVLGEDNRKREWQVAITALGELNEVAHASL
jgi:HEAT repeat protein